MKERKNSVCFIFAQILMGIGSKSTKGANLSSDGFTFARAFGRVSGAALGASDDSG